MKLSEFSDEQSLRELLGMPGSIPAPITTAPVGGAQPAAVDPRIAAQQMKQKQDQKKQIQDAIVQKQKELQDLQKQMAEIK